MKKILLIVCGSVAVKKIPLLIELLEKHHEVKVLGSDAGKMIGNDFNIPFLKNPYHIDLAKWADLILVVPATANTLAKVANGLADNEACATILAHPKPIVFVPAMNTIMYKNIENIGVIENLSKRGHMFIGPVVGRLHDNSCGIGRMVEPEEIANKVNNLLMPGKNKKAIIANGASKVFIDSIRYVTNLSSGEMGRALANELRMCGFEVEVIDIGNYSNKQFVELMETKTFDYYFSPAAFADYDVQVFDGKLKRNQINKIDLQANIDVLALLCQKFPDKQFIAFKHGVSIDEAKAKLKALPLQMVIWTKIGTMGSASATGAIVTKDKTFDFSCSKNELAVLIAKEVK